MNGDLSLTVSKELVVPILEAKIKAAIFKNIDELFHNLHEIYTDSSNDVFQIHELSHDLHKVKRLANKIASELNFINPPNGSFWSRHLSKSDSIKRIKKEISKIKNQVSLMKKRKHSEVKDCEKEIELLDKLKNTLDSLKAMIRGTL